LRDRVGAEQVLLFGSHARGDAQHDSDYDLIVVSPQFEGLRRRDRAIGLRDLFYEVGGHAPLDLICLTPEEFDEASRRITLVSAVLPEAVDLLRPEAARMQPDGNR
jgi:predicted nucleotidyltransferase